jgi:hypothetical protein
MAGEGRELEEGGARVQERVDAVADHHLALGQVAGPRLFVAACAGKKIEDSKREGNINETLTGASGDGGRRHGKRASPGGDAKTSGTFVHCLKRFAEAHHEAVHFGSVCVEVSAQWVHGRGQHLCQL